MEALYIVFSTFSFLPEAYWVFPSLEPPPVSNHVY